MAKRTEYSKQFREQACLLVREQGYKPAKAAKSLGMPESTLAYWLRSRGPVDPRTEVPGEPMARGNAAAAPPDARALQIQVRELEAKVRRLEMEKEILKKRRPSSRTSICEVPVHPRPSGVLTRATHVRHSGSLTLWFL